MATATVDYLNLERGIIHLDITPRILIIDPEDKLRLFDFDSATMVDEPWDRPNLTDVDGVHLLRDCHT